jgi:hypothetical protein
MTSKIEAQITKFSLASKVNAEGPVTYQVNLTLEVEDPNEAIQWAKRYLKSWGELDFNPKQMSIGDKFNSK